MVPMGQLAVCVSIPDEARMTAGHIDLGHTGSPYAAEPSSSTTGDTRVVLSCPRNSFSEGIEITSVSPYSVGRYEQNSS